MVRRPQFRAGFTLVELAVVIVIVGVLAALSIPRFLRVVERTKAAEAFSFLATVRSAQERHHSLHGTFAGDLGQLDLTVATPAYFTIGSVAAGETSQIENSWRLTFTRSGYAAGYGQYTVTFTQDGFDADNSSIAPEINPMAQTGAGAGASY